jgi:hypothetical protein
VSVGIAALACALPVGVEALRRPHEGRPTRAEVRQEPGPGLDGVEKR